MYRILIVLIVVCSLAGCSRIFRYDLVKPSEVKNIHPDSLKWKYSNGVLMQLPVRDKEDGLFWLDVNNDTFLEIETTENDKYYFKLRSVVAADENESGLLGSNTIWRGYDIHSGAERSVFIREVRKVKVVAHSYPATERILPK